MMRSDKLVPEFWQSNRTFCKRRSDGAERETDRKALWCKKSTDFTRPKHREQPTEEKHLANLQENRTLASWSSSLNLEHDERPLEPVYNRGLLWRTLVVRILLCRVMVKTSETRQHVPTLIKRYRRQATSVLLNKHMWSYSANRSIF